MEIGKFKIVDHSQTLEKLGLENTALKNRQNTLITLAAGSVIIALIVFVQYLQMKEELKKNEIRILNPEDIK
jgi:hypothetical protein